MARTTTIRLAVALTLGFLLGAFLTPHLAGAEETVHFGRDIWPILTSRCIECHGEEKQRSGLRLDSPSAILKGSKLHLAVVAGNPDESRLYTLVALPPGHKDLMPSEGGPLAADQIELIRRWIVQGADFEGWTPEMTRLAQARTGAGVEIPLPSLAELPAARMEFNRHVRPILAENCYLCHGPDGNARQADLRLDLREDALAARQAAAGGAALPAITPGDLSKSELVRRIFHPDPKHRMPPQDSERLLSQEDKETLAAWILQGAEYEPHWAYLAPKRVAVPLGPWIANPIDGFILAELHELGLRPSEEADPVTLARRLSFDLMGLPPTPEQVDALAADPSPAAYEALVDELLASPHYGERMAVHWLDQVRYADTNGYHSDETRSVSPYRDYVIQAFNDNLPYDRFTLEQLAGDLLPDPTQEQRIASGFNRMNQLTAEGGAQSMEYRAKYNADRVRAMASVWMGATLGCAECHDHKFDPYTAKDFYSFAAFFADLEEYDVYSTGETWDPLLPLPTPEERERLDALERLVQELEAEVLSSRTRLAPGQRAWENELREQSAESAQGWQPVRPSAMVSEGGATLSWLDDYSVLAEGENPERDTYTLTVPTDLAQITGIRLELLTHPSLKGGLGRAGRAPTELSEFEVEVQARGEDDARPAAIAKAEDDRKFYGAGAFLTIDGTTSSRWLLKATRPNGDRVQAVYTFAQPIDGGPGTTLTVRLVQHGLNKRIAIGRFRLALTTVPEPTVGPVGIPEEVRRIVALPRQTDPGPGQEQEIVFRYYRAIAPELAETRGRIAQAHDEILDLEKSMLTTLPSVATAPRVTRVLRRGNWQDTAGEIVEPGVPAFLPPLKLALKPALKPAHKPEERRGNRLDLARWLVDGQNPLTARVFVNRLWKLFFGAGISRVLDDLGAQGEWPTHPELLDWLALELQDSGWDVKHVVKQIVLSKVYRQSSEPRADLAEVDPENRLLARQSRFRLEAEMVRDNALAVSGLLSKRVGGRSVKPYQPDGYWRNANTFGGESLVYEPSAGEDQYRRGLYTFWKRSFLHPSLLAFDAPSREECTAQRPISNTPLQALVLLNDPTYVEAARVMAERTLREGGGSLDERLRWVFRRALSRPPSADEARILGELLRRHEAKFAADPAAARALIHTGQWPVPQDVPAAQLAAWTSVTRAVLNLPETITRF